MADQIVPKTESEQDRITANFRQLDLIIEITQMLLSLGILGVVTYLAIKGINNETITNAFFLAMGFYFAKENKISKV
jgi:hypothetical protein